MVKDCWFVPGERREVAVGFGRGSFVGDMCGMVKELPEKCTEVFRLSSAGIQIALFGRFGKGGRDIVTRS